MISSADLYELARLTLRDPKAGFRAVLSLQPSAEARWLALGSVVLLSTILTQVVLFGVPDAELPPWMQSMRSPVGGALTQAVTILVLAFGISVLARGFGGAAQFSDALWLVIWIEFLVFCAEIVVLGFSIVLPFLADLMGIASVILFFWLVTQATVLLNGFTRPFLVFVGVVVMMLLAGMIFIGVLTAIGVMPMPVPTAGLG